MARGSSRVFKLKRRRTGNSAFRKARKQKLKHPLHVILKYMGPLMLTLIVLRYQGKIEGPFEKNPAPTWCFLATTCLYSLLIGAVEQSQTIGSKLFQIFCRAARAFGALSIVSLVSIFLPHPISIVPITIYSAVQCFVLTWPSPLHYAYSLIHGGIVSVCAKFTSNGECKSSIPLEMKNLEGKEDSSV